MIENSGVVTETYGKRINEDVFEMSCLITEVLQDVAYCVELEV